MITEFHNDLSFQLMWIHCCSWISMTTYVLKKNSLLKAVILFWTRLSINWICLRMKNMIKS